MKKLVNTVAEHHRRLLSSGTLGLIAAGVALIILVGVAYLSYAQLQKELANVNSTVASLEEDNQKLTERLALLERTPSPTPSASPTPVPTPSATPAPKPPYTIAIKRYKRSLTCTGCAVTGDTILIEFEIKNTSSTTLSVNPHQFSLVNSDNHRYSSMALPHEGFPMLYTTTTVLPGKTLVGAVHFDDVAQKYKDFVVEYGSEEATFKTN
jgi:hypothetical protein